jgi:multidrug efflux pump subunit AcrB
MMGIIALSGIVVKNGIVLRDFFLLLMGGEGIMIQSF